MNAAHTATPTLPSGMVAVTQEQFFAALKADQRDIMPSQECPEYTTWRDISHQVWGWSAPGWRNPRAHREIYAIYPSALAKAGAA